MNVYRVTLRKLLGAASLAGLLLAASTGWAQGTSERTTSANFNNEGAAGATFQKLWVGARAAGMAGGFSGLADDITALYWNPAGIARLQGINAGVTYTQLYAGITHNFVGVTLPISDKYRAGVSLIVVDYGSIKRSTLEKDYNAGTYNANDLSFGLTIAGALTERFSFGATAKYIRNSILDLSADGFAFDAGSLYITDFYHTRISLDLSNLGSDRRFEGNSLSLLVQNPDINADARKLDTRLVTNDFPLPLAFRIGVATDVFQGDIEDQQLNVALDFSAHSDGPEQFNLGGEYLWNNMVALRAGYAFNQDQFGLGAGAGFRYRSENFDGNIDYAINPTRDLGIVHRVSLSARFE